MASSYLDYICVDDKTGSIYPIQSKEPNGMAFECLNKGGTLLEKSDYLDPSGDYVCQNKGGKIYSKKQCDQLMLMDPETVFYKYYKTKLRRQIEPKFNNYPATRQKSRTTVLLICSILTIMFASSIMFVTYNPNIKNKISLVYLYSFLGVVIVLGCITYLFCPLGLCYLEPNTAPIRINPLHTTSVAIK